MLTYLTKWKQNKNKMIFQLVQKNLWFLGISKSQSVGSFYTRMLIGCLLLITHCSLRLKFLFGVANSFQQYAESIFMSSGMVVIFWCYASLIYKREELFEFIDKCDELLIEFKEGKFHYFSFNLSNLLNFYMQYILLFL